MPFSVMWNRGDDRERVSQADLAGGGIIEAPFEDQHRFELFGIVHQNVQPPVGALRLLEQTTDVDAALEGLSVKAYIIKLVEAHWQELEKKGLLPKRKG